MDPPVSLKYVFSSETTHGSTSVIACVFFLLTTTRVYSVEDIAKIEVWCNSLPRKILNYKTPEEYFDIELDRIYRRR